MRSICGLTSRKKRCVGHLVVETCNSFPSGADTDRDSPCANTEVKCNKAQFADTKAKCSDMILLLVFSRHANCQPVQLLLGIIWFRVSTCSVCTEETPPLLTDVNRNISPPILAPPLSCSWRSSARPPRCCTTHRS
jgi:hypothetical protein